MEKDKLLAEIKKLYSERCNYSIEKIYLMETADDLLENKDKLIALFKKEEDLGREICKLLNNKQDGK